MNRRCGNCRHTQPNGDTQVLCFGAPPTVTGIQIAENGNQTVTSNVPVLPNERRPCALHAYRWFVRKSAA